MHDRSSYTDGVDFNLLAEAYPKLKPHLRHSSGGRSTIDFKNVQAQRCLTEALLRRDFDLTLSIPDDRLCPAVPNRLDYVLWIQDIVDNSPSLEENSLDIWGVDIGTGASAIYPLLACRLRARWSMLGTEIDELSARSARGNVSVNGLEDRISVQSTSPENGLLDVIRNYPDVSFAFTMCNPPFYSSKEDIEQSAASKEFDPHAVCTGADVEMITKGGEVEFVGRLIQESVDLPNRCRWYTSLLGKVSSVNASVQNLQSRGIQNYGFTEFVQGSTKRWAICWSLLDTKLPDRLCRLARPPSHLARCLPPPSEVSHHYKGLDQQTLATYLTTTLESITDIGYSTSLDGLISVSCSGNTWSRRARRKQSAMGNVAASVLMKCIFTIQNSSAGETILQGRHIQGHDHQLFESFWNHVVRKIGQLS